MLALVTLPVRSALGVARILLRAGERDVVAPLEGSLETETHILDAVTAIHRATASIEAHVEVIDTLADSVAPLGASVDRLTDTMHELVALMAPMGAAERGIHNVERFFGRHRHKAPAQQIAAAPVPGQPSPAQRPDGRLGPPS